MNSLGMEFVPVRGTNVLFSVWDTRVRDYRAYAGANRGVDASWKHPGFRQHEDHPVVNVSWSDATAFCAWLTQTERKEGKIGRRQEYRLPTEKEWGVAVGAGKYPWGNQWPPPQGSGNYAPEFKVDDYKYTSPVGSFKANRYGLCDMGGNVFQWCGNLYNPMPAYPKLVFRPVHGASWGETHPKALLSSSASGAGPAARGSGLGFRCVLVSRPPR